MPAGRPPVDLETKLRDIWGNKGEEFVNKVAGSSIEELNSLLAEVAKDEAYNQEAKDMDLDLQAAKENYEAKGHDYKEATKVNKLRTKFILRVLGDKGGM